MDDRELLQMALDALENAHANEPIWKTPIKESIEALRARLAQPEQEPVAWITGGGKGELWWHQSEKFDTEGNLIGKNPDDIPLYTAPPQRDWQGLTDEEILEEYRQSYGDDGNLTDVYFAQAIEAKLKEKNNG